MSTGKMMKNMGRQSYVILMQVNVKILRKKSGYGIPERHAFSLLLYRPEWSSG